jgi:hypothetical protein
MRVITRESRFFSNWRIVRWRAASSIRFCKAGSNEEIMRNIQNKLVRLKSTVNPPFMFEAAP